MANCFRAPTLKIIDHSGTDFASKRASPRENLFLASVDENIRRYSLVARRIVVNRGFFYVLFPVINRTVEGTAGKKRIA